MRSGYVVLLCVAACAAASDDATTHAPQSNLANGGSGASDTCTATAFEAQALPLNLLLLVQVSGSLGSQSEAIRAGLETFVTSPEAVGVGMGLTQYPRFDASGYGCNCYLDCAMLMGGSLEYDGCQGADLCECSSSSSSSSCSCWYFDRCDPSEYVAPDVELAPLPGAAMPVAQSIQGTEKNETPLGQAFSGATQYLTGWAVNHPDQNAAIVLVADSKGATTFCPQDAGAPQYAVQAATSTAAIRTYVLALGDEPDLDQLAAAGGSVAAQALASLADLPAGLETVRQRARACAYEIPQPSTGSVDPTMVNVRVKGASDALSQVPAASDCANHQGGWYYDDPDNPRKIVLCHESCADLTQADQRVEVLIGCPTEIVK